MCMGRGSGEAGGGGRGEGGGKGRTWGGGGKHRNKSALS